MTDTEVRAPQVVGTRPSMVVYRVVRSVLALLGRTVFRMTISGRQHLPATGPYVIAPIHRSVLDSLLLSSVTRRRLRYMGKAELWNVSRASSWFLDALGGFPVHRGGADREAMRRCIEVIESGEPLVVFPEGTRRSGPVVEDLFEGAAFVAARTGVPIIPVGISGTEAAMPVGGFPRPGRVHFQIGPPIPAPQGADGGRPPRRATTETTEQLRAELQRLFDEARARVGERS